MVVAKMAKDLCDESRGELDMIFPYEHLEADQYFVKWFKRDFHAGAFGKTIAKWRTFRAYGLRWVSINVSS